MSSYEVIMIMLGTLTFVMTVIGIVVKLLLVIIDYKKENNEKK